MRPIPRTQNPTVLRTEFSQSAAWEATQAEILKPVNGFQANVDFLDDPQYSGVSIAEVVALSQPGSHDFVFVVDATTLVETGHPILVVDASEMPGRTFRVIPSEISAVESNLRLANMGFEEFAASVGADGVFRGFPR